MSESLRFQVESEWACDFVRKRVYYEGMDYSWGLETLRAMFQGLRPQDCDSILKGTKKIVGVNGGSLVDDDKYGEYEKYLQRVEKKRKQIELREHISAYPYNYFDPYAAWYSPKEFERSSEPKTLERISEYFVRHLDFETGSVNDRSETQLRGGTYSISDFYAKDLVTNKEEIEKYHHQLYLYWKEELEENRSLYNSYDLNDIERRQRNYEAYLENKMSERLMESRIRAQVVLDKMEEEKAQNKGYIDFYDGAYSFETLSLPYKPTRKFSKYGIISPQGDFYSLSFANHNSASKKICDQLGIKYYEGEEEPDNSVDLAKDKLFELGYIFVNINGSNRVFYGKYGDDVDSVPQRQFDTVFDYRRYLEGKN